MFIENDIYLKRDDIDAKIKNNKQSAQAQIKIPFHLSIYNLLNINKFFVRSSCGLRTYLLCEVRNVRKIEKKK